MKVFIAGIMQGNRSDDKIYSQDYRKIITKKLHALVDGVEIINPDKTDPDRLTYTYEEARDMFFRYCKIASEVDLFIAYIPEASMGSAVEMWIAHKKNIPIITISPLKLNWVVKLLSTIIYFDIDEFLKNFNKNLLKRLDLV
ncbi:MAG: hypothetical protein Q8P26_00765 [Candidatus Levybacteria bacterium]|nr:hypothetical protein [Candidatus Levybacteria bacterium]